MKKFDIKKFSGLFADLPLMAVFTTKVKVKKKTDLPLFVKCGNTTAIKYTPSKQFSKERFKRTARVSVADLSVSVLTNAITALHEVAFANLVIPEQENKVAPETPVVVGSPSALAEGAPDAPAAVAAPAEAEKPSTKEAPAKSAKKTSKKPAAKKAAPKKGSKSAAKGKEAESATKWPFPGDQPKAAK